MLQIWKTHKLEVISSAGDTFKVDAKEHGHLEIFNNDLVYKFEPGQFVDIFIQYDKERNIVGVHGKPMVEPGEFANLKLVSNSNIGSFFDWGMDKDLFCPFAEQKIEMEVNHYYIVYVYIDEKTQRIVASTKISKFISEDTPELEEKQKVNAMILNKSQLGYNAIVENKYMGLLYSNEVFTNLKPGTKINAVVHKIREDNKIDLRMFVNDGRDIAGFEEMIIKYLNEHEGKMKINDESDPEIIYATFGISKKNFKKALGGLYKKGLVDLSTSTVKLLRNTN
ncbi:MAG: hypothetical protein C0596_10550 [Marinilabiliales bacterium]|nr:MAG: hypothetical protein C0596_10550 [Marinilabiliales bacterium]